MSVLKCKMCGGNLNIIENDTVCTCEYCGTTQTIPLADSDKKIRLFNRANEYRLNNDFSRAYNAYEAIVSENPKEAEAYWGMVLSEYGVEYVDDPKTKKKIPTCHRTSLKSVLSDKNYLKALELADLENRMIYEDEANELDKLQKTILSVSSREKPYDVFISYKENDSEGNRTIDSVIGQDLYDELTNKGLRVFFSRISLEDKFGQNYEPFIFNALRSAKVLLLVVTNNENCNATWVKNEWSRYLEFIKDDPSRSLIPVIKDMSPYELPDELQKLQVLDLGKIGSRQDLIRGVLKITGHLQKRNDSVSVSSSINTDALLKRGFMFLEDKDFQSAGEYFDRVLDNDPENGDAYLGKVLTNNKESSLDELIQKYKDQFNETRYETKIAFEDDSKHVDDIVDNYVIPNYLSEESIRNQYSFDPAYQSLLQCRIDQKQQIKEKLEYDRLISRLLTYAQPSIKEKFDEVLSAYDQRVDQAKNDDESAIKAQKEKYESFLREADQSVERMYSAALQRKEKDYQSYVSESDNIISFVQGQDLINNFISLDGYKDSEQYIEACKKKIKELEIKEKNERAKAAKKRKTGIALACAIIVAVVSIYAFYTRVLVPKNKYAEAVSIYDQGDVSKACQLFLELGEYKDSAVYLKECFPYLYASVNEVLEFGSYEQDNDTANGKEKIEWIVLEKQEDGLLIISKNALDNKQFNDVTGSTAWQNSSIRGWLNNSFFHTAFSSEEQAFIKTTTVATVSEGEKVLETEDKVFLLNVDEVKQYFDSDEKRKCISSDYAAEQGTIISGDGTCWWWLRSPGANSYSTATVTDKGIVRIPGIDAVSTNIAVRPVLWINTKVSK